MMAISDIGDAIYVFRNLRQLIIVIVYIKYSFILVGLYQTAAHVCETRLNWGLCGEGESKVNK